ncbi:ATP-binding protein [Novosphingobium olei]|uniref:histidine kinase n=1 Tax=Novosphingobium olei TaxID=2728851 RepID=A0A7Y0BNA4_9SPHN|nr:ATP-binding protein [Novosphingobium olei]NML92851.1 response regulator [Novosphingobium olei]
MIRSLSERALILAPVGRDAQVAAAMLAETQIDSTVCTDIPGLVQELDAGAGFAIVTEEAFTTADLRQLDAWIERQPEWSDFPFVLLTHRGGGLERNPAAARHLETLGNVTFVERPFHPTTLVSLSRSALRGRRRQYEARARLEALSESETRTRGSETRLRFLAQLEEMLFGASTATDAMGAAVAMLAVHLGASRCAYADVGTDSDRFWIREDYCADGVPSSVGAYSLDLFGSRAAAELRAGSLLVVHDIDEELAPGDGGKMFGSIGIRAIITCPLIKDGRLTAMMAVHQNKPRPWSAAEVELVRQVAERCWAHVERAGAEARLREGEERLRLAVENAEVGFWDVDEVNDKLIWPARTKAMFGISPDVPVTMDDFYQGLHPDDLEKTAKAYAEAADPQIRALYDVEYRTVGKEDKVVRWVAAKGRGIFDASNRCLRVAGTVLDITVRKTAEAALNELNATLEARIEQAIAEREQVQEALRQSQKMEAMGQLTGGVAHDFNNLLAPIVGSLDLLQRRGIGNEREQRLIAGAIQSAERARLLVQRLLAFARRQPLQPVPVDIADLVKGMGDLVESTTGPQIKVTLQAADKLPLARADPNQLEMALLNLTVNARDAMPRGGELCIAATAESVGEDDFSPLHPGTYVRLSVADTGNGMSEETLSRAIEPFFSTKGVGKGTGLGLSMVHGLAAQLGGNLTIESRPGMGTTVALWLPTSPDVAEATLLTDKGGDGILNRGVALLVDDEFLVRMSTADMLTDLGYEVVEAESAEQALHIFDDRSSIDILITDHLMPGMTGTELIRNVRALRPSMPVLMVSGYAQIDGVPADIPRLAKPFRAAELVTALESVLGSN